MAIAISDKNVIPKNGNGIRRGGTIAGGTGKYTQLVGSRGRLSKNGRGEDAKDHKSR